ncbi:nicotinate phosphoribosyltransferase [uncultured Roseburia sp.]|nr:nicotinate phosphoribosyltransferase [uncultured Roseburia sp.]
MRTQACENRMRTQNLTLLTDLYEITMMQGYFETGNQDIVVFDTFYRETPSGGGYAVAAGLEQVIDYVKTLQFTPDDIRYLRSLNIFQEEFLKYLSNFRFSGSIYAVPEGTVIFPREPIVKIVAPIMEAQLLETAVLNIINHQSLIATKASRVCYAAQNDGVMEFGLRRAQGPDSGIYGARAAVIGGCCGTSNVLAGQLFDIPVKGTHAHSWIMSFPDEYTAFKTYAKLYPTACILLIDTYDTLKSGVPNAIRIFQEMKAAGIELKNYGVRLDSGDLAYLSKKVRRMLDEAGFEDAVISASNDLDEYLIESLKIQGAKITSWGVGTSLITSRDCPAFGGVYKLAAIQDKNGNFIPKIKLSENTEKVTNPGNKTVYRIYDKESKKIRADLICLEEEVFNSEEDLLLFDPNATWKRTLLTGGTYTMRELLIPIFDKGKCIYTSPSVMEIQEYCTKEKDTLWNENMRFVNPAEIYVDLSDKLYHLKNKVFNELSEAKYSQAPSRV